MTELKYKLEHGVFVEKNKITFAQWYNTWLEEYKEILFFWQNCQDKKEQHKGQAMTKEQQAIFMEYFNLG